MEGRRPSEAVLPPRSEGRPAGRQRLDRPDPAASQCPSGWRRGLHGRRLVKRPLLAAPAAREQHPELVGRAPGISQPGQAAAPGDIGLGDQVGHVRFDGAG
jgi:hypothetical protein